MVKQSVSQTPEQIRRDLDSMYNEGDAALKKLKSEQQAAVSALRDSLNRLTARIKAFDPTPKCPQCGQQGDAERIRCTEYDASMCTRCSRSCDIAHYCDDVAVYCADCRMELRNCEVCSNDYCTECQSSCEVCDADVCCDCTYTCTGSDECGDTFDVFACKSCKDNGDIYI